MTYEELKKRVVNPQGYSCMDWYLCMKPDARLKAGAGTDKAALKQP